MRTVEPKQEGEKRVAVESPAQPFLLIGYKRPDQYSPDDVALDVLSDILSDGRTGIIYKEMVRDKKIALGAGSQATFPGGKYPSLFLFFVAPSSGHTVEENEKAMYAIIDRVKKEKVERGRAATREDQAARGADPQAGQQFGSGQRAVLPIESITATGASCSRSSRSTTR